MIELRALTRKFGDFVAVNHLDLQVPAGSDLRLSWSKWSRKINYRQNAHGHFEADVVYSALYYFSVTRSGRLLETRREEIRQSLS